MRGDTRLLKLPSAAVILALLLVAAAPSPARAPRPPAAASRSAEAAPAALPAGFVDEVVLDQLGPVTAAAWASDGRLFLARKDGRVHVVQAGALLPDPFIDISAQVNSLFDRGLNGLTLHPDFPATPYVYLWFTYDPPDLPATNPHNSPDGTGARVSRLLRVSADPAHPNQALPGSEFVLLGQNSTLAHIGAGGALYADDHNPYPPASCGAGPAYVTDCLPSDSSSHSVGAVLFGPDGALYVGHGDGSGYIETDPRALRAQSLDSLAGKILRIDPLTGLGYPDNPFYDGDVSSNRSRVWAYGLRNPFRFTFQPGTGQLIIGDVGWNTWEELNQGGGHNFGWPCYEGPEQQSAYALAPGTAAACQALYALGPAAVTAPFYTIYRPGLNGSITGGVYAAGSPYPAPYQAAYFFADFAASRLFVLFPGPGDEVTVELFDQLSLSLFEGPVQFLLGPDGNVYYLNLVWPNSSLHRLRYVAGGNTPPLAHLAATPTHGGLPLAVSFSASGSADPDGQPLTFAWDFGDGGAAVGVSAAYTYTLPGTYAAVVTVTDSLGLTATAQVAITAGNHAPQAAILTPLTGTLVTAGQVVTFTGGAADVEDGDLSGAQLQWSLLLHHADHLHPNSLPPTSGVSGSLVAPDHGDHTWLELCLTATDLGGLSDSDCRPLWPSAGLVQLRTVPPGLPLVYAGVSRLAPFDAPLQVEAVRTVQAPAAPIGWVFAGWNDGAPGSTRPITGTLAAQVFTATYTNTAPLAIAAAGPLTGAAPLAVTFTATASYDPDGPSVSYHWDFGDGGSATSATAAHLYGPGHYVATLTVTDLGGLTAQAQFFITPGRHIWLPRIGN